MLNREKLEFIPYYEIKSNYVVYTPCLLSCEELKTAEIVTDHQECSYNSELQRPDVWEHSD